MPDRMNFINSNNVTVMSINPQNKTEWDSMLEFFGLNEPGHYAEVLGRDLWKDQEER